MSDLPDLSSHGLPDYSGFDTRVDYFIARDGQPNKPQAVSFLIRGDDALADADPELYRELMWDIIDIGEPTEDGGETEVVEICSDDPKRTAKIRALEQHFGDGITLAWDAVYEDDA